MFDATNPTHLAQLRDEVLTDPAGMGYDPGGPTAALLEALNLAANNVGGEQVNRPIEELQIPEIAGVIDPGEYGALSQYGKAWVNMFITRPADEQLSPYQTGFLALFDAQSITRQAVLALRAKPASRAEVLWGVNAYIGGPDWFAARDSA